MSKYFLEDVLHIEGSKEVLIVSLLRSAGNRIGVGLIAYLSETCLLCYGNVPLLHSRALDPYHYLPYMRDYLHDIDLGDSEFNEEASRGFKSIRKTAAASGNSKSGRRGGSAFHDNNISIVIGRNRPNGRIHRRHPNWSSWLMTAVLAGFVRR